MNIIYVILFIIFGSVGGYVFFIAPRGVHDMILYRDKSAGEKADRYGRYTRIVGAVLLVLCLIFVILANTSN